MDPEESVRTEQMQVKHGLPEGKVNKTTMWVFAALGAFWAVIVFLIFW